MCGNNQRKSFKRHCLILAVSLLISAYSSNLSAQKSPAVSEHSGPKICQKNIKRHIQFLASSQMKGRRGIHALEAARYVAAEFQELKLLPLFPNPNNKRSYFQNIPGAPDKNGNATTAGQNVAALLPGCDANLKNEYIIIAAHHDHLGLRGDRIFHGADDNASGVAMVLELARALSTTCQPIKRSILFVSFDMEEHLLFGSRWFTAHPPVRLKQIKMMIVADMLGRSLGDMPMNSFFLFGSEHAQGITELVLKVPFAKKAQPVLLSDDFVGTRSDYGPFRDRKIPFLFASTGQSKDYHTDRDTVDKIDFEQVTAISQGLVILTMRLSCLQEAPAWIENPKVSLSEVEAILSIVAEIEKQASKWKLNTVQRLFVSQTRVQAQKILKKKQMTPREEAWLTRTTQLLLFTVF